MALRTTITTADIRAALALLPKKDQDLPAELEHRTAILNRLRELANSRPSTAELAELDPADLQDFVDDYLEQYTRAEAAEKILYSGGPAALNKGHDQHLTDYLPTLLAKLQPVAEAAVQRLIDAAAHLPAGDDALDADAVLATGAGDAHRAALEAARDLETMARVLLPKVDPDLRVAVRDGHAAAAIIAPPATTTPTRVGRHNRRPVDPDQADQNRATAAVLAAWQASPTRTLLAAARGEYGACKLSLATTPAEADQRATLLHTATLTTAVDDGPDQATRATQEAHRQANAQAMYQAAGVSTPPGPSADAVA